MRGRTAWMLGVLAIASGPAIGAEPSLVVDRGAGGVTQPRGMAVDGAGRIWVADDASGVCRVDPAASPPLVASPYCRPVSPGSAATRLGPKRAVGLALDPATSTLLVGDGASGSGAVWRMQVDASGSIASAQVILSLADDRVSGISLGFHNGVHLDYVTDFSASVTRVFAPATCAIPCAGATVGRALVARGLAEAPFGQLFLTEELAGATRIDAPGLAAPWSRPLEPAEPGEVQAVAADPARGRVYFAITNPRGGDRIDVLDVASDTRETYLDGPSAIGGFASLTALAVEPDGSLLIADDGSSAIMAEDSGSGTARIHRAPLAPMPPPRIILTSGPLAVGSLANVSVSFRSLSAASFECRLDGAAWAPCGSGPVGTFWSGPVADGPHAIEIRGTSAFGTGPTLTRAFTVDTRPPVTHIQDRSGDEAPGGRVALRFTADEPALFECAVDGGEWVPCVDGWSVEGVASGSRLLSVRARDAAGNLGPAASVRIGHSENEAPVVTSAPAPVGLATPPVRSADPGRARAALALKRLRSSCAKARGRLVSHRVRVRRAGRQAWVTRYRCVPRRAGQSATR